jgi:hypothetical protein
VGVSLSQIMHVRIAITDCNLEVVKRICSYAGRPTPEERIIVAEKRIRMKKFDTYPQLSVMVCIIDGTLLVSSHLKTDH